MTSTTIFQESFSIAGIMCHAGCGAIIERGLNACFNECQTIGIIPAKTQLLIDAEPQALGIHRIQIKIQHENQETEIDHQDILTRFKNSFNRLGFALVEDLDSNQKNNRRFTNWFNILINLTSLSIITFLTLTCAPSLLLTVGLTALTFLTTAYTARTYLINFLLNLSQRNFSTMSTTITLGWVLSVAHTLYHSWTMPLTASFSMMFMSFIMPIILITVINGMDEIKKLILNTSQKMHLHSMKTLFPQLETHYEQYTFSNNNSVKESPVVNMALTKLQTLSLKRKILSKRIDDETSAENKKELLAQLAMLHTDPEFAPCLKLTPVLLKMTTVSHARDALQEGMIITVNSGSCFPVDCILIHDTALVDSSILTGEPQQQKNSLEAIPAGALNLSEKAVTVYVTANTYNSTINTLLFKSNRAQEKSSVQSTSLFSYFYSALIVTGITASILTPIIFGIFSFSLLLENAIGILFAVCPCTIAIAHQLPILLSSYQRNKKGILLRDENLLQYSNKITTVVFDKTGTLTTGNSEVDLESARDLSPSLWQKVYLLEKNAGRGHPLAKAIMKYYEDNMAAPLLNEVKETTIDSNHRGLSGVVQGKLIHIGNAKYFAQCNIKLPTIVNDKIHQGHSPIYIAEAQNYQGVIFIKHQIRQDTLTTLSRLKQDGKRIMMLTGDNTSAAERFNQQNSTIFEPTDIHAEKTPQEKETFLAQLMELPEVNPKETWFVGDGLNDAPCARIVSDKGGISCAMTSNDKAAFFTDITLNGSLEYIFQHNLLNQFLKKIIFQNQLLLTYSFMAFLAFIITFSIIGIAVSPFIPLIIMVSTTLFTVFNSYRVQLSIDNALDKKTSWIKQFLASDASIGLLFSASLLLICSVFISTLEVGEFALSCFVFTSTLTIIGSTCALAASIMIIVFAALATSYFLTQDSPTQEIKISVRPETVPINRLPVVDKTLAPPTRTVAAGLPTCSQAARAGSPPSTPPFV